jgi:hypothetical protein
VLTDADAIRPVMTAAFADTVPVLLSEPTNEAVPDRVAAVIEAADMPSAVTEPVAATENAVNA